MSALGKLKFWGNSDPFEDLVDGLAAAKGDADALALLPYDDGTFFLKQANFDKDLIGGQGGYETPDGDKIVMDGDGQPVKDLFGVPMLLAVDPTEHAAAVDPIKALVAQKDNIGEWLRIDREGNLIQVGPALKSAADSAIFEDPNSDEHWTEKALEYDSVRKRITEMGVEPAEASPELIQQAVEQIEAEAVEAAQNDEEETSTVREYLPWEDQIDDDVDIQPERVEVNIEDSVVGDKLREMGVEPDMASEEMLHAAMEELAKNDDLKKIYDIAPPAAPVVTDGGHVEIEQATHYAVDQSKATDLIPKTTSTTELNTALDKARMEEHDEDKWKNIFIQGMIAGSVIAGFFGLVFVGMFALLG